MAIEIKVPALGESVTEATVGQWFKKPGEAVNVDEPLVELETDKVTVEVPAPAAGVLADIKVPQGTTRCDRLGAGLHQRGAVPASRGSEPAAPMRQLRPPARPKPAPAPPPKPAARGQRRSRPPPTPRRHAAGTRGAQDDGGEGPLAPTTCTAPAGAARS